MLLKPLQFQLPCLFMGRVERSPEEFKPGSFAQFSVNGNLIEFENSSIKTDVKEFSPYLVKGFVLPDRSAAKIGFRPLEVEDLKGDESAFVWGTCEIARDDFEDKNLTRRSILRVVACGLNLRVEISPESPAFQLPAVYNVRFDLATVQQWNSSANKNVLQWVLTNPQLIEPTRKVKRDE